MSKKSSLGEKFSDKITQIVGSWKFILFQSVILVIWIILNVIAWVKHWDPYSFIFLNLTLSFQAAYTVPIILMSQNREADRERRKNELDLETDRRAEREIKQIQTQLEKLEKGKLDRLIQLLEKK